MREISLFDVLPLIWFLLCWASYAAYAKRRAFHRPALLTVMHSYRTRWMREMLTRDNRIVDTSIAASLLSSLSFFASTTVFILAGLIAVLGATERAILVISELPFAQPTTAALWELKMLLMIVIFIYAFFKFTWSLRQFMYFSIMIGSAPPPTDTPERYQGFIDRAAAVSSIAAKHFNHGLRGYYFGLAALAWFVSPWLFIAGSAWVVLVLYRREFLSDTLQALGSPDQTSTPWRG